MKILYYTVSINNWEQNIVSIRVYEIIKNKPIVFLEFEYDWYGDLSPFYNSQNKIKINLEQNGYDTNLFKFILL